LREEGGRGRGGREGGGGERGRERLIESCPFYPANMSIYIYIYIFPHQQCGKNKKKLYNLYKGNTFILI